MIVRISGEDQFRIEENLRDQLNQLDAAVVQAVEGGSEDGFKAAFSSLLDFVRVNGAVVSDEEIETSDLILPPDDITVAEAAEEFTGEGLIPD